MCAEVLSLSRTPVETINGDRHVLPSEQHPDYYWLCISYMLPLIPLWYGSFLIAVISNFTSVLPVEYIVLVLSIPSFPTVLLFCIVLLQKSPLRINKVLSYLILFPHTRFGHSSQLEETEQLQLR